MHSDEEFAAVMLSALPHLKATPVPMLPLGSRTYPLSLTKGVLLGPSCRLWIVVSATSYSLPQVVAVSTSDYFYVIVTHRELAAQLRAQRHSPEFAARRKKAHARAHAPLNDGVKNYKT